MVDRDEVQPVRSDFDLAGEEKEERASEIGRLIALSDGVFAFAMTLLIVSVEVPTLSNEEAKTELVSDIGALWPQILSYVIGFLVIGFMWSAHRRTFSRVQDYDDRLVKLNIFLLMLVAFLPLPTGILGRYGNLAISTILYALVLASISVVFILILDHLDRNRNLMTRGGVGFDFARAKTRNLVTAGFFLLSILVALIVPGYAQVFWILLAFNHEVTERLLPHLPGRFQERSQS